MTTSTTQRRLTSLSSYHVMIPPTKVLQCSIITTSSSCFLVNFCPTKEKTASFAMMCPTDTVIYLFHIPGNVIVVNYYVRERQHASWAGHCCYRDTYYVVELHNSCRYYRLRVHLESRLLFRKILCSQFSLSYGLVHYRMYLTIQQRYT